MKSRAIVFFFLIVSIIIIGTGLLYANSMRNYTNQIFQELAMVANSKMEQIENWHTGELIDASIITKNPILNDALLSQEQKPTQELYNTISAILKQISSEHDLSNTIITDQDGNILYSSNSANAILSPEINKILDHISATNAPESSAIYTSEANSGIYIDYIAPMQRENGTKLFFVSQISIKDYLLPTINTWPSPMQSTGEALLYTTIPDGVLIFNKLTNDYIPTSYSFNKEVHRDILKVVVNGKQGPLTGIDYKGVSVFSYTKKIEDVQWFLTCKIDRAEAFDVIGFKLWKYLLVALLLIIFIGIMLTLIYNVREKKHYQALLEAQEIFRTTLYSIGDAVITTDSKGIIMQMNQVAEKMTGYFETEAQGRPLDSIFKIYNEDTNLPVENPVKKVIREHRIIGLANHTILRSKDGTEISISDCGAPIMTKEKEICGVVLVFRDQTQEHQYQQDIEESRRRMLALMSNLPGIAYRCLDDRNYTMQFISDGIFEITGYTSEELLYNKTLSYNDLIVEEFQEFVHNEIQKALKTRSHFQIEYKIKARNGEIKWVWEQGLGVFNEAGKVQALEGFISDITERKRNQFDLIEKDTMLQNITRLAPVGIFKTDLSGKITYANPKWCEFSGITASKAKNVEWVNFVHPEDKKKVISDWIPAKANMIFSKSEYRFLHEDGKVIWVSGLAVPEQNAQGEIWGYIGTVTDITNLKTTLSELDAASVALEKAQDIAKIGNWEWNTTSNKLTWSKQMYKIFDIEESMSDLNFIELTNKRVHPEDRHLILGNAQTIVERNQIPVSSRFRIIWSDGSIRVLKTDFENKFKTENGQKSLLGIIQDVTDQVEIEDILRSNKFQYEYLFLNNPLPMWIYEEDQHNFLMVNDAALKLYGYSREDIMSLTLEDIHFSEISDALMTNSRAFSQEKNIWRYRNKEGEYIYIEIRSHHLQYDNKSACLMLMYDISKRLLAEKALIESEEQYRNLFENHSAKKLIVNPNNGKIENANKSAANFYGWEIEELKKMSLFDIDTDATEETKAKLEDAKNDRKNHFEVKQKLANGTIRIVEVFSSNIVFGKKNCLHLIIHDVTHQKEAEKQLKLLSQSVEQNPVSVVITNSEGIIEYVNPQLTKVSGYTLPEVIGKTPHIFSSGEHTAEFYKELWTTILGGTIWQGEIRNKNKKGLLYWENAIIAPIFGTSKNITHFVALKEDITEKKKLNEELVNAKKRAEESERLKTSFLANMSHEIRTPLNSILGFSSFLTSSENLSEEEKEEYTQIINKNAEGLLHIINDIIDISILETKQLKIKNSNVKINELLTSIYAQMYHRKEEMGKSDIKLTIHLQNDVDFITDEIRLEQIFNNLIINSIKFTKKGHIDFGVEQITENGINFFVSDTGIGIGEDKQEFIYDLFRQVDTSYTRNVGGNGLGLAIVKNLVDLMHGKISLSSELGKGTTFKLFLPKIIDIE